MTRDEVEYFVIESDVSVLAVKNTQPRFSARNKGFAMVVIGASLWGLSGTAAQKLFQTYHFTPDWLMTARMLVSGLILLLMLVTREGIDSSLAIWRQPRQWLHLLVFATFGLMEVQYTYFVAIAKGNAATATFLQYLGPAFITIYLIIRTRKLPNRLEGIALLFAIIGTFMLVTNGSIHRVNVPHASIVWGLLSALGLAFYTLYPTRLIKRWGSSTIVGWAMLTGGVMASFITPPWHVQQAHWNLESGTLVLFVIVFGTLIPFYLYLNSLHYITPSETSLLATSEPLSAAVTAVLWLHIRLGMLSILGGIFIIFTVILLAWRKSDVEEGRIST